MIFFRKSDFSGFLSEQQAFIALPNFGQFFLLDKAPLFHEVRAVASAILVKRRSSANFRIFAMNEKCIQSTIFPAFFCLSARIMRYIDLNDTKKYSTKL